MTEQISLTLQWKNLYAANDTIINGASVKKWLYNQSDGSYNVSYQNYAYNQSSIYEFRGK